MKVVFYSLGLAGLLSVSGYSAAEDEAADENTVLDQEYAALEKMHRFTRTFLNLTVSRATASLSTR